MILLFFAQRRKYFLLFFLSIFVFTKSAIAGPPYDTDDPEPVDLHHWEIFCASMGSENVGNWATTAPHVEINYGPLANVQIQMMAPLNFYAVKDGEKNYGYGDTEFGIKYRFINKDSSRFQVSIYPDIQVPTGNSEKGLGTGNTQLFLPIWIEKIIGKWTTNGGGGYWINPGTGNKNYEFIGIQTQYQYLKNVSIGGEIYDVTASEIGYNNNEFNFNIGTIIDLSNHNHLVFSIGRSIIGNTNLQWYVGYQLTI